MILRKEGYRKGGIDDENQKEGLGCGVNDFQRYSFLIWPQVVSPTGSGS